MNLVRLTLLQAQLEGVAEIMGSALARSAFSPNIRVRRDFSCAVFDSRGALLAQAAHIPVHLGSMPDQIKRLIDSHTLAEGDLYIANDPYNGGTHLPDITLMEPVFKGRKLLGVVAARAHHADVGGAAPGSMASQPNIYGDGLRIPILPLARGGQWEQTLMTLLLANMRSPGDREGDLLAQRAALHHGKLGMLRVFKQWASSDHKSWLEGHQRLREAARNGLQSSLRAMLPPGAEAQFEDYLEVGDQLCPIRVQIRLDADGCLSADFQGTSPGVAASFNATLPVTKAAVCYVVRCLTPAELPLNQGFLDVLKVEAPSPSLVAASYPLAVAAGNVETSQRIVDVVFGAFSRLLPERVPAASAGTMNNLSFGFEDPRLGVHYETAGGGAGGSPGSEAPGASAVQIHMTNTLATPAEVLEQEFPVVIERHTLRPGSGGAGRSPGGDGTVKEIRFLEPARISFMATRRKTTPYGLAGGLEGAPGAQAVRRGPDGSWESVGGASVHALAPNDAIRLSTPGGGGWGEPKGPVREK